MKILLEHGAYFGCTDTLGWFALHFAPCWFIHHSLVDVCLVFEVPIFFVAAAGIRFTDASGEQQENPLNSNDEI